MKKLLVAISILGCVLSARSQQTVPGDRIIARQSLFLRDAWVDTVYNDTVGIAGKVRTIMTADAISKLFNRPVDTTKIPNFSVKVRSLFSGGDPVVYNNGLFTLRSDFLDSI